MEDWWDDDRWLEWIVAKNAMSRNRFLEIRRHIHCSDIREERKQPPESKDKLFKIRILNVNAFISAANEYYIPHQDVVIDERLIPAKNRITFRVRIANKPGREGIKAYLLADAKQPYVL